MMTVDRAIRLDSARATPARSRAFLDALRARPLLCDGAMGTMLAAATGADGTPTATPLEYAVPEELNKLAPEHVLAIHRAYIAAGADVVQTNSFGANAVKLATARLEARTRDFNRRAAALAREAVEAAGRDVWVAGSMGPTGQLLTPLGDLTFGAARDAFAEQAAALAAGGVDLFLVETMADLTEALAALTGAREAAPLPVLVTLTFEPHGRTIMGVTPDGAARALEGWGADAVGANCGYGPRAMVPIIRALREAVPELPLIAQANAGQPDLLDGRIHYDCAPEEFAAYAPAFVEAGVRLLGACCGSTPAFIRSLAAALAALRTMS